MGMFQLSNGEQIYFEDTGKGEKTIVMLHGWSSSHEVYAPVVPSVAETARVITYDHRGHGGSKGANRDEVTLDLLARDLDELLDGLGLTDVTLLGWSMGAGVVMDYCKIYGCAKLREVILCDMTPRQLNDDGWKLGLYQGRYTWEEMERDQKAGKSFYSLYKDFAIGAIPKLRKVPGFLLRRPLKKRLQGCDEKVLRSLSASMKAADFRDSVGNISVPVHYFYAVPGSLFSPELADWYRDHVSARFEAVEFPDSTHMLVTDNPEKFASEVIRILEQG